MEIHFWHRKALQNIVVTCANRGKKAENRQERLRLESEEIREQNRQTLLSQEFLSISSAAALLSISRPTIYKMIA
ncbi:MAG: hypothetical protein LBJ23_04295, partial [Tannerella sp.]|nr:hypothetical protein [Tannerella sp.]